MLSESKSQYLKRMLHNYQSLQRHGVIERKPFFDERVEYYLKKLRDRGLLPSSPMKR